MKTCLIVGGDSSLGAAVASLFRSERYRVLTTSRRTTRTNDSSILRIDLDTTNNAQSYKGHIGSLDALIFCTGYLPGKSLPDYTDDDIYDVFNSNILVVIRALQIFTPHLNTGASVLFTGSIAGSAGGFDEAYASSKSALTGLTKSLAKKASNSIRFNCVSPGLIEGSGMSDTFSPEEISKHKEQTPTGTLVQLSELARIYFDLCQPHWSSLNGHVIDINGGRYV